MNRRRAEVGCGRAFPVAGPRPKGLPDLHISIGDRRTTGEKSWGGEKVKSPAMNDLWLLTGVWY